jgi:hypothetical protein
VPFPRLKTVVDNLSNRRDEDRVGNLKCALAKCARFLAREGGPSASGFDPAAPARSYWRDRGLYPLARVAAEESGAVFGWRRRFLFDVFEVGGFGAGAELSGRQRHDPMATAG